jgi:hypothetical protein
VTDGLRTRLLTLVGRISETAINLFLYFLGPVLGGIIARKSHTSEVFSWVGANTRKTLTLISRNFWAVKMQFLGLLLNHRNRRRQLKIDEHNQPPVQLEK